jgi:type I restriction enzyme S subunit
LVPTEAEIARAEGREYEPASVLLERILVERKAAWAAGGGRGKYVEPVKPETEGLPGLPEGWCWTTVDQLCRVGTGATPKRGDPRYWEKASVPWVTSSVVNGRFVDRPSDFVSLLALKETNLTLYPPGTLLLAMYGEGKTRGKSAITRFQTTTNQALAALVTTSLPATVVEWLRTFMDHNYATLRRESSGGVQPNLNIGIVKAISVPLPPLHVQESIVTEVDRRLSVLDALETTLDTNLARCARLRQSILKRAFEGRLVPPTGAPTCT